MRRRLELQALLAIIGALVVSALTAGAPVAADDRQVSTGRMRVAVLDFTEGNVDYSVRGKIGDALANALSAEMTKDGRFEIYERASLEKILKEQGFQNQGLVSDQTAVQIGKLAGVNYLAYGSVETAGVQVETSTDKKGKRHYTTKAKVVVNFKATDVSDGQIWKQARVEREEASYYDSDAPGSAVKSQLLGKALQKTVGEFVRQLVPQVQGRVAVIDAAAGTFVVTLGLAQGVSKGLDFRVIRKGEEVKDPVTGEVLGSSTQEICRARAVDVQAKFSRLEPGDYSKDFLQGVKWRNKSKEKLPLIQVGDIVETVESKKTGGGLFTD